MELIALVLSILSLIGVLVAGLLVRGYLASYSSAKGSNAASKEDLAHLTEIVEGVKAQHTTELERVKAALSAEGEFVERRRRVYEEMCAALRVFVAGHNQGTEGKERFHAAHAAAWLWASDQVLVALNQFIELQVRHAANPESVSQQDLKNAYSTVVVAMRRDAGFAETGMAVSDYQFVQF